MTVPWVGQYLWTLQGIVGLTLVSMCDTALCPVLLGQWRAELRECLCIQALAPDREMLLAQGRCTGSSHPAGSSSVPWAWGEAGCDQFDFGPRSPLLGFTLLGAGNNSWLSGYEFLFGYISQDFVTSPYTACCWRVQVLQASKLTEGRGRAYFTYSSNLRQKLDL